jgi:hypothetical protein
MVTLLAESGIALRAGQHCAQPLLAALGVSGTLRASFAPYNTQDDVYALVHAVDRAWKYWWINDDFSPFWHPHHRRDLTPDVYPAQPVGR